MYEVHELYCTHEEADDRLIFHVHQCVVVEGATRALVATEDTDVIVSLMYHYLRWQKLGLQELWLYKGRSKSINIYALHDLVSKLGADVVDHLPAAHALSGCDTTSKVGTKAAIMKMHNKFDIVLKKFGEGELTEGMVNTIERLR